jgi:hypothetical protein
LRGVFAAQQQPIDKSAPRRAVQTHSAPMPAKNVISLRNLKEPSAEWRQITTDRDLQSRYTALLVANPDDLIDFVNENLTIADFSGCRRANDGIDEFVLKVVIHNDFQFDFGKQIDRVLVTVISLGVTLLAAVAADFGHRHTVNSYSDDGFFYGVKLRWLDDGFNLSHSHLL